MQASCAVFVLLGCFASAVAVSLKIFPTGPWQRASPHWPRQPLCDEGKLLPELYVLGAKKASTTSFAADLMSAGIESAAGYDKEWHFFDSRMNWSHVGDPGRFAKEKNKWMEDLPACPHSGGPSEQPPEQKVLADFTPENLLLVPVPEGAQVRGPMPPWDFRSEGAKHTVERAKVHLPNVLKTFYGKAAAKLEFVILLREPLRRMQSGWYASRQGGSISKPWECSTNFSCALESRLALVEHHPVAFRNPMFSSMFGRQVAEWLKNFDARQFLFVPYKQYTVGDKDSICATLSEKLDFAMNCDSRGKTSSHKWHNPHPSLDLEVPQRLLDRFHEFMRPDIELLVTSLHAAHLAGAGLANYPTGSITKDETARWLYESW